MGISEDIKQTRFKSELNKAIINIIYTGSWIEGKQSRIFKGWGLTMPQFNIMRILRGQHPNPATVNLLIDRMIDKSSNASRIVDRLELKGLVKRKQCDNDRRAVDVFITQKGLNILAEIDLLLDQWEMENNNLTEEESIHLNALLDKLRG